MFTNETLSGLIPALPRVIGYQPRNSVVSIAAIQGGGVLTANAAWREPDITGTQVHEAIRRLGRTNPSGQPLSAAVVVLWSDTTDGSDLEWLALDVAAHAHPSATPVVVVQADPDRPRWRHPTTDWHPTNPTSPAVVAAVAQGLPPVADIGLDDRVAVWQHNPTLAAAVAEHTSHTFTADTVAARRAVVDDVWAIMVAANNDPTTHAHHLGTVIAALNAGYWLRDTLMLRCLAQWPTVAATCAAAVAAAEADHLPDVAAVASGAAFCFGDELSGREALTRAMEATAPHGLTALLVESMASGIGMTRITRDAIGALTEPETITPGL